MNLVGWIKRHPEYATILYYVLALGALGIVFLVRAT